MTSTYKQYRQQEAPSHLWGMLVALGIAVTVFGLLLVTRPFETAEALARLAGLALVLSGITDTLRAARSPAHRSEALLGIVLVIGGAVLLGWPDVTLSVVAVVVGVCLVVAGLVRVVVDIGQRRREHGLPEARSDMAAPPEATVPGSLRARGGGESRTASMILGVVTIVVGVMALIWPSATIAVLAVLFGVQLVFQGVGEIILGLALRPKPQ